MYILLCDICPNKFFKITVTFTLNLEQFYKYNCWLLLGFTISCFFFFSDFCYIEVFILGYSKMLVFSFRAYDFYVLFKESFPSQYHQNMHCVFSCESFRVLLFTVRTITHLELIFQYGVRWRFNFNFFHIDSPTALGPFIIYYYLSNRSLPPLINR